MIFEDFTAVAMKNNIFRHVTEPTCILAKVWNVSGKFTVSVFRAE
jgi:hypothetical protein